MYRSTLLSLFRLCNFPFHGFNDNHFSYNQEIIGELRRVPYADQWRMALVNGWYHVKLEDHSLLVFDERPGHRSYGFVHCPLNVLSMRRYLNSTGREYTSRTIREFQEEYEQVLDTAKFRENVTPIRFDYDQKGYQAGVHPVAHIHIGLQNEVRIGLKRPMSAVSFSLFVMRQMYPECWARLLKNADRCRLPHHIRGFEPVVEQAYWAVHDELELHLC